MAETNMHTEMPFPVEYSQEEYRHQLDNLIVYSCDYLRKVFAELWYKSFNYNWNNGDLGQRDEFKVSDTGKRLLKKLRKDEFEKFLKWKVEEWDISLLNLLFQVLFSGTENSKVVIGAIKNLKNVRNFLAHHPNKKVTEKEFEEKFKIYRDSCLALGMSLDELDEEIQRAAITSSPIAWELVKRKLQECLKLQQDGKVESAIELCSEALDTPSLLPKNRGIIYESRADLHLAIKDWTDSHQKQIRIDLSQAIKLNEESWRAYYLFGKFYRRKSNFKKAVENHQKALAISPGQDHVRIELDGCRVLNGTVSREDNFDPRLMPIDLLERLEIQERETSLKLSVREFLHLHGDVEGDLFPGQKETFQGHRYSYGWKCKQDYTEAARYYSKANRKNNPEGMYNLGLLYMMGQGVPQNTDKALEIFRKVANMSPSIPGMTTTSFHANVGVAGAQYTIGQFYDEGVHLNQDFQKAAMWYTKAMQNGVGNAANNLGLLYRDGVGHVQEPDCVMAEMCWKLGVGLQDVNAAANLMIHYMNHYEPEKCLAVLKIGREREQNYLYNVSDEEIQSQLAPSRAQRKEMEGEIEAFERQHKLQIKGWTFLDRIKREECMRESRYKKGWKVRLNKELRTRVTVWNDHGGEVNAKVVRNEAFLHRLEAISMIAPSLETAVAVRNTIWGSVAIIKIFNEGPKSTEKEDARLIEILYNICQFGFHIFIHMAPLDLLDWLKSVVEKQFRNKCGSTGDTDMKVRFCYAQLNLNPSFQSKQNTVVIDVLKVGLNRYPNNVNYYYELSWICVGKDLLNDGLRYADQGLKRFPNHGWLLYSKALVLRKMVDVKFTEDSSRVALKAFALFLEKAGKDHRKTPEAYYQIADLYRLLHENKPNRVNCFYIDILPVKRNYDMGIQAEQFQLECYLPYGQSDAKLSVEWLLQECGRIGNVRWDKEVVFPDSVLQRKPYLRSPYREGLVKQHRKKLADCRPTVLNMQSVGRYEVFTKGEPKLKQRCPRNQSNLQNISLVEMNPTVDRVYENCILELMIIEEPLLGLPAVNLLAEDENGDVTRLYLYVEQEHENLTNLKVGCKIAIMNPYMRLTRELTYGIRLDEPKCLLYRGKLDRVCRFCGQEEAQKRCLVCRRPYCSEECLTLDQSIMGHSYICIP